MRRGQRLFDENSERCGKLMCGVMCLAVPDRVGCYLIWKALSGMSQGQQAVNALWADFNRRVLEPRNCFAKYQASRGAGIGGLRGTSTCPMRGP